MAVQPPLLANPPAKPALNTPGYSPYPQLDMAAIEATLRAEAAKRGLPYDPSDLDDVNRNYSNSGGTTTSGNYDGALNLVLNKYDQRISNTPNSPDGQYHAYPGGNYNTNLGPERYLKSQSEIDEDNGPISWERQHNIPGAPAGSFTAGVGTGRSASVAGAPSIPGTANTNGQPTDPILAALEALLKNQPGGGTSGEWREESLPNNGGYKRTNTRTGEVQYSPMVFDAPPLWMSEADWKRSNWNRAHTTAPGGVQPDPSVTPTGTQQPSLDALLEMIRAQMAGFPGQV